MKKRSVAILLALTGGFVGLHKFYLREVTTGIVYVFLATMFFGMFRLPVSFFLGFFDAFRLMYMSEEEFNEKYNTKRDFKSRYRSRHRNTAQNKRDEKGQYSYQGSSARKRKNPFKISGIKKYEDFDLEEALKDFEQALIVSPEDSEVHYKMAATYSLLEKKEKSYNHLKEAVKTGFQNIEDVMVNDHFAFLRIQADFGKFKSSGFTSTETKGLNAPKSDLLQDDVLLSQLNKLKTLREKGLLSEREFLAEKEKLFKK